MVYYTFVLFWL